MLRQAHVRGYQVRKHYKVICWAVGILDKVVLRWRRKGAGLRGFRNEAEPNDNDDESEDEDILKVFRKQKVDVAIGESVSRVLSMVDSPEARLQYHRMLERYRQAKVSRSKILLTLINLRNVLRSYQSPFSELMLVLQFMEVTRSHIIKLLATLFICQIPSSSI